jgi:hypothetical protein
MSYEQKYMKYKQKYLELKQLIDGLENNNTQINNVKSLVESNVENTENIVLSDTPVNEQSGGYSMVSGANGTPVSNMSGVPNVSNCAGSVNPQPNASIPVIKQNPVAVTPPATAPLPSGTGTVPVSPTKSKNLTNSVSEEVTTTELKSDVDQIFNQLGGHEHYDPFDDDIYDPSSSDLEDSSDASASPSDHDAIYSPIASATLPPGRGTRPGIPAGPEGRPAAVPPRRNVPTGLRSTDVSPFQ